MYNESDWYGYICKMKTDFYIRDENIFNKNSFSHRIKIFFKNLDIRQKIKQVQFQNNIMKINDSTIMISKDLYFPHKNFKTILDIPVNFEKLNNDKKIKLILEGNSIIEKDFNIANLTSKDEKIDVDIIKENNIDSCLCIKSDKCYYVEKSVLSHNKIRKDLCKYPANELLIKNNNDVMDVCIYNDVEEKVFILKNRFQHKDYYIYKWETGSLWKDFIEITDNYNKIKIYFDNERSEDIDEMKSILESKEICYILEEIKKES